MLWDAAVVADSVAVEYHRNTLVEAGPAGGPGYGHCPLCGKIRTGELGVGGSK